MKKIEWQEGIECCGCDRENDTYVIDDYGEVHCMECWEEMKPPREDAEADYWDTKIKERKYDKVHII